MRRFYLLILGIITFKCSYSQLTVNEAVDIEQIVQTLVGPGIEVSNITFNGNVVKNSLLAGTFSDVSAGNNKGLGIGEGIVLSTLPGKYVSRSGKNVPVTEYYNNLIGKPFPKGDEPDLEKVAGGATVKLSDASILEFDFVPAGDEIEVKFVFASDEYNDFVCSPFNDAFGFFLSGPGINGPYSNNAKNIALIPDTDIEIAINTVNGGKPGPMNNASGCDLPGGGSGLNNTKYFVTNLPAAASVSDMLFQGFTTPILAKSKVQCGEKYHIKLAIADVADWIMNSAIFLEKGSLKSEEEEIIAGVVSGNQDGAIEGCEDISIKLERIDITKELTVNLEIIGGTATEGDDFSMIPRQIVIPAGEKSKTFTVDILADNEIENIENVQIRAYFEFEACKTIEIEDTVEFKIKDLEPLNLEDQETCKGGSVQLNASGGDKYEWTPKDGLSNPNIGNPIATPDKTTIYTVTVSNADGTCERKGEVKVEISEIKANAGPDLSICNGGAVQLNGEGGATYSWKPATGLDNPNIKNPTSTTTQTITYTLTVKDLSGTCEGKDEVTVTIDELVVDAGDDVTICAGDTTILTATGGGNNFSWLPTDFLSNPDKAITNAFPNKEITYVVTMTDITGNCSAKDEITISIEEIIPDFEVDPVCLGEESKFINLTNEGNFQNIKWLWDFGDGNNSNEKSPLYFYSNAGKYNAKLNAQAGSCSGEITKEVEIYEKPLAKFTITPTTLRADNPTVTCIDESTGSLTGVWDFGDGVIEDYIKGEKKEHTYQIPETDLEYLIKLVVESEHGCTDSTAQKVKIKTNWAIYFPNSFTPNGDGINDIFKAEGYGINDFQLLIYNRWGEVIYNSTNFNVGWNGKVKNKPLDDGVFVWKARVTNNTGEIKQFIGHVSLFK